MSLASIEVQTVAEALDVIEVARPGDEIVYFVESPVKSQNGLRTARAARIAAAPLFAYFGKLQGTYGRNHVRRNGDGRGEHIFVVISRPPPKMLAQARGKPKGERRSPSVIC